MEELIVKLLEKPKLKALVLVASVVLPNIVTATLFLELGDNSAIHWSNIFKSISFYVLLLFCLVLYIFFRSLYQVESNLDLYADNTKLQAYCWRHTIPEYAAQCASMAKEGRLDDARKAIEQLGTKP